MTRSDTPYTQFTKTVNVALGGCEFVGVLYERLDREFDLYLHVGESDLQGLEVAHITWLRTQADSNREIFVDHLGESRLNPLLVHKGKRILREWLERSLGIRRSLRDYAREGLWLVADILDDHHLP